MRNLFKMISIVTAVMLMLPGIPLAQTVTGVRDLPDTYEPGGTLGISVTIDVDENNTPSGLIVKEMIPLGWTPTSTPPTFPTSTPFSSFDENTGIIEWLFSAFNSQVIDRIINYYVSVPQDESGEKDFSGELNYNDPVNNNTPTVEPVSGNSKTNELPGEANYPQIISVTPGNQEAGVSTDTTIQIVFDKSMSPKIFFEVFDHYSNDVEGELVWSNTAGNPDDTLTLTPYDPLKPGRVYHIRLWGFRVRDDTGTYCLDGGCANRQFSFQTAADPGDTTPPTVRTVRPYDGKTDTGLMLSVRVYFSEGMNKDSFIGGTNVTLTGGGITSGDYTVEYDFDGGIQNRVPALKINLNKNLNEMTTYTVTIGSSVTDISGNPMGTDFTSTFTTGTADITPPEVTGIFPVPDDTNVSLAPVITIRFSENVRRSTLNTGNITLQNLTDSTYVPLFISSRAPNIGDRSYVMLAPEFGTTTLDYNTQYGISVSGVQDQEGNTIVPVTYNFTTVTDALTSADPIFLGVDARGETGEPGSSFVDLCVDSYDFDGESGLAPDDFNLNVNTTAPKKWPLLKGGDPDDVDYCYASDEDEGLAAGKLQVNFNISDSDRNTLSFTWPIRIYPTIPMLIGPADAATDVPTTPTFTWDITGLIGPSDRTFVVVLDDTGSQTVWSGSHMNDGSAAYSLTVPDDQALDNCTTYLWYAGVADHHFSPRGFAFSVEESFTTGAIPGDSDCDGILDDGDGSGTAGDNPCTGGITTSCDDNCVNTHNPDQADTDSDGAGEVCDTCPNDPYNDEDGDGICGDVDIPDATTLISPSGSNIGNTPTYTWNKVWNATWYYLVIQDASGNVFKKWYSSTDAGCDGGTCSVIPQNPLPHGNAKWWLQTYNEYGKGPWSGPLTFTAGIGAATLVSPSGDNNDNIPTYTWNAVPDVTWYYLVVQDPSGNVFKKWYSSTDAGCDGGTCSVTPQNPLPHGSSKWWLQTYNQYGRGPWSGPLTFTAGIGAATLVSPSGDNNDNIPTYTWNAVPNVTWYYLVIQDASGNVFKKWYSSTDAGCDGGTCSVTPENPLPHGSAKWWLQTYNQYGRGPWSGPLTFTAGIGAATLVSPSGDNNDNIPTYTWNAVPSVTWYYLVIQDASGNVFKKWYSSTDAGCDGGTCSVTPQNPLPNGSAKWWLQTYNQYGRGPWSGPMTFTAGIGVATLVSPGGDITNNTPAYTWNEMPNATWYYLVVQDASGNIFKKWYTSTDAGCDGGTCSVTPENPLPNGSAKWWLQTYNEYGRGPWSGPLSFTMQ